MTEKIINLDKISQPILGVIVFGFIGYFIVGGLLGIDQNISAIVGALIGFFVVWLAIR